MSRPTTIERGLLARNGSSRADADVSETPRPTTTQGDFHRSS
jgi:hypothetical protein